MPFSLSGGVALATDPPLQLHYHDGTNGFPVGYNTTPVTTYKMANNGGGTHIKRIGATLVETETSKVHAFYYQGSWSELTVPSDYTFSSARAGNNAGHMVGDSDGQSTALFPCLWTAQTSFQRFASGSFTVGSFWDISENDESVGYYVDGQSVSHPVRKKTTDSDPVELPVIDETREWDGGEARAVNKDGYIGGQLFIGPGGSPAVVWKPKTGGYDIISVSDSEDWTFSDRSAYIVGMTDVKSGDSNGPYAVGYVLPGADPEASPGQPFVYSIGSDRIKFVGTLYGPPSQMSNQAFDNEDKVVSFCGNSPRPYIWIGSPDRSVANNGVADDLWAFFDPDASPDYPRAVPAAVLTGLNNLFEYAGSDLSTNRRIWTSTTSPWTFASSSPSFTLTRGSGVGGSLSDVTFADGRYVTYGPGLVANSTQPEIEIKVEENLPSGDYEASGLKLAVRATFRAEFGGVFKPKIDLWNWTTSGWDTVFGDDMNDPNMSLFMVTATGGKATWTNVAPYVDHANGDKVRARLTVKKGISAVTSWNCSFEQLRIVRMKP